MIRTTLVAATIALLASPAWAGELSGEQAFVACQGCHSLDAEAGHAVGPNLAGLNGRKAGSADEFAYSPALKASGIEWGEATLTGWILSAEGMVPGTWMLYHNHLEANEVESLVAYILRH